MLSLSEIRSAVLFTFDAGEADLDFVLGKIVEPGHSLGPEPTLRQSPPDPIQ